MGLVASCFPRPSQKRQRQRQTIGTGQISHPYALQPKHGGDQDGHERLDSGSTRSTKTARSTRSTKPYSPIKSPARIIHGIDGRFSPHQPSNPHLVGSVAETGGCAHLQPLSDLTNDSPDISPHPPSVVDAPHRRLSGSNTGHYNQRQAQWTQFSPVRQRSISLNPSASSTNPPKRSDDPGTIIAVDPARQRARPSSAYSLLPPIDPLSPLASNLEVWRTAPPSHPRPLSLSLALETLDTQLHDLQYTPSTANLADTSILATDPQRLADCTPRQPYERSFAPIAQVDTAQRGSGSRNDHAVVTTVPIRPPPAVLKDASPARPSPITSVQSLRSARSAVGSTGTYRSKNKLKKVLRVEGDWEVVRDGTWDGTGRGQYNGPIAPMPLGLAGEPQRVVRRTGLNDGEGTR